MLQNQVIVVREAMIVQVVAIVQVIQVQVATLVTVVATVTRVQVIVGVAAVTSRNLKLIDAVIALHEIARTVAEEVSQGQLHDDIRDCADRLHQLSLVDNKNSIMVKDIINKAKE